MSCRNEFKTQFANYNGYDFALKVATGLVVVTAITAVMGTTLAAKDAIDFYNVIIKKK